VADERRRESDEDGWKSDPIQLQSSAYCLPFIAITIGTLEETWKNRRDPI
jgi:hypothetical protein